MYLLSYLLTQHFTPNPQPETSINLSLPLHFFRQVPFRVAQWDPRPYFGKRQIVKKIKINPLKFFTFSVKINILTRYVSKNIQSSQHYNEKNGSQF